MLAPKYAPVQERVTVQPARRRRRAVVASPVPRRASLPISRRACVGMLVLIALCSALVAYRHTALTQMGYQAEQLQADLAVLQRQNSELEVQVASLGSLARVEQLATSRLGMTRATTTVAIASLERSGSTVVATGSTATLATAKPAPVAAANLADQGGFIGRLWDLLRRLARNTVEAARSGT